MLFSTSALIDSHSVCWQAMTVPEGSLPAQKPNKSTGGKVVQAGSTSSYRDQHVLSDSVTARTLRSKRLMTSNGASVPK